MKIYSKFKDYYDHTGYYDDDGVVWVRKEKILKINNVPLSTYPIHDEVRDLYMTLPKQTNIIGFSCLVLGFCGKIYPIYMLDNFVCNKASSLIAKWNEINNSNIKQPMGYKWFRNPALFNDKNISEWKSRVNSKDNTDLFISINSPIFIINNLSLTISPKLYKMNLQKLIDPYTAHQEIDRYLGNELAGSSNEMPDFGDELKRDAHGMDKWSFKTRR